jgi:membrane-associated phospholipid phosphatase
LIFLLVNSTFHSLQSWDYQTFHLINEIWTNRFLDLIFPWIREKFIWIPFYLCLVYIWIKEYRWRGFLLLLGLILSIIISDLLSAHLIKNYFHRLRPCQDLNTIKHVILRIECGTGYSFVSSHASNHFTVAAFTALWFRFRKPILEPLIYLWAGIISYAQIYVGLHYPLDVMGGALLGLLIGWSLGYLCIRRLCLKSVKTLNYPLI